MSQLKSKLANQQSLIAKRTAHTQNKARASFHVIDLHAKKLKPFSDGESVKDCMDILVELICS